MKKEPCNCKLCIRSRDFKKHLETVTDPEAKKFFENIYGQLWDIEEEVDYLKVYQNNLKTIYPKIYKETTRLQKLEPGTENFPEINI